MKQYTTIEAVSNYLLMDIDPAFQGQVTDWIKGMTRTIDNMCNRSIAPELTDSSVAIEETFKYDGDGTNELIITDCIITEVSVDGVTVEGVKYPANKPYSTFLKLADKYFTKGLQNVLVTGIQAMNEDVPEYEVTFDEDGNATVGAKKEE
jgi:hypothetical protein